MVVSCLLLLVLVIAVWLFVKTSSLSNENQLGRPQSRRRPYSASSAGSARPQSPALDRPRSGLFMATSFYRLKDGSGDYQFRFEEASKGSFQIYILHTPRGKNGPDAGSPHVLHDEDASYICWSVPIEDYDDAKKIAAMWAEATETWHKTGKVF